MDAELPDKQYLKIGEVSRLTSLNSSVLRFWETEFETLKPVKSRSGQRLYTKKDVEIIIRIKALLYEDKLTIAGARNRLLIAARAEGSGKSDGGEAAVMDRQVLEEIREELRSIRDLL